MVCLCSTSELVTPSESFFKSEVISGQFLSHARVVPPEIQPPGRTLRSLGIVTSADSSDNSISPRPATSQHFWPSRSSKRSLPHFRGPGRTSAGWKRASNGCRTKRAPHCSIEPGFLLRVGILARRWIIGQECPTSVFSADEPRPLNGQPTA